MQSTPNSSALEQSSLELDLFEEPAPAIESYDVPADAVNLLEGVAPIYAIRFTPNTCLNRPFPSPGVYELGSCCDYYDRFGPTVCWHGRIVVQERATLNDLVERLCRSYCIGDEFCYIDRLYYSASAHRLIVIEINAEEARARRETDASDFR